MRQPSSPPTDIEAGLARVPRPRLRGQFHAAAAVLSVGALVWLVRSAHSVSGIVAAWIYGVAALLCYMTSSGYHVLARSDRARGLMRRADHSMIYVLIAGSFTPICLLAMTGPMRWVCIATIWSGALLGIVLSAAGLRLPRLGIALYIILGWAALAGIPSLWSHPYRVVFVLAAGIMYTVGAALFGVQRPRLRPAWFGYHEFWHCMGVAAGALLFAVNLSLIAAHSA